MKRIFILLLIGNLLMIAHAQQNSALLLKYRECALEYNHDLKSAKKNITASIELEKSAKADVKPKIDADADFKYTGNPTQLSLALPSIPNPIEFKGKHINYGARIGIIQPIYTGGKILESIRLAESQKFVAESQAEVLKTAVCFQTDMQYWNTVARQEIMNVVAEYCNAINTLAQTVEERVTVGLVEPQDLLMAQVKCNEAQYELLKAKTDFETSLMALNSIIGAPLNSLTIVDNQVSIIDFASGLLDDNGDNRPEFKIAQDQIKIAQSHLKINDSKYKPQIYIGAEGSYSSPGYNFKSDLSPNYGVYAKLSMPIFQWGKRGNEKKAYAEKVGIATDNLNNVKDAITLEVETAKKALAQAIERVSLSENSLSKSKENEQKALERYQEGRISIIEVIEAQTYRQTSQINFVVSKAAAQGYYSQLLKALNAY